MRRSEREIKDTGEIEAVIRQAQVCRVAFAAGDSPYIVPVSFGYQDSCLYFHSAPEGRKMDILRLNPRVCFEMDTDHAIVRSPDSPCKWSARYRSVIGFGTASIIEEPREKAAALNIITGHYGADPYDFSEEELAGVSVVRIEIESMTGKKAGY